MRNIRFLFSSDVCFYPNSSVSRLGVCLDENSELQRFLSLVFTVDERSNAPVGDLQVLFSDKVSPEIREWVKSNLLTDASSMMSSSRFSSDLDDDTITALTRNQNESKYDYINRVTDFIKSSSNV